MIIIRYSAHPIESSIDSSMRLYNDCHEGKITNKTSISKQINESRRNRYTYPRYATSLHRPFRWSTSYHRTLYLVRTTSQILTHLIFHIIWPSYCRRFHTTPSLITSSSIKMPATSSMQFLAPSVSVIMLAIWHITPPSSITVPADLYTHTLSDLIQTLLIIQHLSANNLKTILHVILKRQSMRSYTLR